MQASIVASAPSLLLLCHAKAPNYGKQKAFKDLAYYSEWLKVADAVIKVHMHMF